MVKDNKIFNGMEAEIKSRIYGVLLIKGKTVLPKELIEKHVVTVKLNKDEKSIGITIYNGLVSRIKYNSPFKGQMSVGDIVMFLNGSLVHFDKRENDQNHFTTVAQKILSKPSPTIEIGFLRLKTRLFDVPVPKGLTATEDYKTDTVYIYQYQILRLGLHVQKVMGTAVVSYTTPLTISSISFNIGETILAVDDDKSVDCLEKIKQRIREGCTEKGFASVTVTYPTIDILRNSVRNQINTAAKETDRPNYSIGEDARKFALEGMKAVKTAPEPKSILIVKKVNASSGGGENSKTGKKTTPIEFRSSVGEHDIPSEWNSKLFVWLPPLKTTDSEKNGGFQASSVYKKPLN